MKSSRSLVLLSSLLLSALPSCSSSGKSIAIVQLMTHTSLNEINAAIVETIKASMPSGYTITQHNPEADTTLLSQTMAQLDKTASIVVAITTPVAQSAANRLSEDKPIVFAACSDPIGAGLVKNLDKPGANITGTSDAIQVESILDKARIIDPDLKTLGFIYNPSEANSVTNKGKIEEYCRKANIELQSSQIAAAGEMSEVASVLCRKVDAIFVTDDNTVASAMSSLSSIAREAKVPCYTGADSMVKDGGMFCLGTNYTDLGHKTGEMVLEIANGKKAGDIPVRVFNENLHGYLNLDYVEEIGFEIPSSIMDDPLLITVRDKKA